MDSKGGKPQVLVLLAVEEFTEVKKTAKKS